MFRLTFPLTPKRELRTLNRYSPLFRSISIFALIAPSIFGTYETGVSVCAVRDRSSSGWADAARQQQQQTSDCLLHISKFFARLRPGETLRSAVHRSKIIA